MNRLIYFILLTPVIWFGSSILLAVLYRLTAHPSREQAGNMAKGILVLGIFGALAWWAYYFY